MMKPFLAQFDLKTTIATITLKIKTTTSYCYQIFIYSSERDNWL